MILPLLAAAVGVVVATSPAADREPRPRQGEWVVKLKPAEGQSIAPRRIVLIIGEDGRTVRFAEPFRRFGGGECRYAMRVNGYGGPSEFPIRNGRAYLRFTSLFELALRFEDAHHARVAARWRLPERCHSGRVRGRAFFKR